MLAPWKESFDRPRQHIKKQRHHFAYKCPYMVFLVVLYGCENCTVKKAEHPRIDAFELWCWRWLWEPLGLQAYQSILKEINGKYSLEGLVLKLRLQSFVYLMRRADSLEKTLMLGRIEGRRKRGNRGQDDWMVSPTWWIWVWASCGRWWRTGKPGMLQSMASHRVVCDWVTEQRQK